MSIDDQELSVKYPLFIYYLHYMLRKKSLFNFINYGKITLYFCMLLLVKKSEKDHMWLLLQTMYSHIQLGI